MWFGPSNQLIQIDQGTARKYIFNASTSPISIYANIGASQVPGQRYFSVSGGAGPTAANPYGAPGIYELVYYKSTAMPAPQAYPSPVYWTDQTYTTVTGVESEGWGGSGSVQSVAGYLMANTTDQPSLTAALLQTAQVLIQVAGPLQGAAATTATTGGAVAAGSWIIGANANWGSDTTASGTAPGTRPFGIATSAVASGVFNILLLCDII